MVRHADFSYAILGKTISIVDLDLGGPVGPMDNHVHNFNPEWPPDKIIGTFPPRGTTAPPQDYERALWLWQRKPKRLLYRHPWMV